MSTDDSLLPLTGWDGQASNNPIAASWLVENLLFRSGLTMVSGGKGWGKTSLVVDLLTAVATGGTFLGRKATQGLALHFAPEEKDHIYRQRLNALALPPCPAAYRFCTLARRDKDAALKAIEAHICHLRPALVALDPIGDFLSFRDLNDYASKDEFLRLKEITDRYPETHLLLTHHTNKTLRLGSESVDASMAAVNGTVAVQSYVDAMLMGSGSVEKDYRYLNVWLRSGKPEKWILRIAPTTGRLVHEPLPRGPGSKRIKLSDKAERVFEVLASSSTSLTRSAIKGRVHFDTTAELDAVLVELRAAGRIEIDPSANNSRASHYRAVVA